MALPSTMNVNNSRDTLERLRENRAKENPMLAWFGDNLPDSGLYPARDVAFYWDKFQDESGAFVSCNFRAVYRPIRDLPSDDPRRCELSAFVQGWFCTFGNDVAGWMVSPGLNPERVFGSLFGERFVDEEERGRVLVEVGRVQECEWARRMLPAFLRESGAYDVVDPESGEDRILETVENAEDLDLALEVLERISERRNFR